MTSLLISVRDAAEARTAREAGADVIDVKEPDRGPLGGASRDVIEAVVAEIAGRAPVSVALGELAEQNEPCTSPAVPPGVRFAKLGLAGCREQADWPRRWGRWQAALPGGTLPVAVVYADGQRAGAPQADDVLRETAALGCRWALVDTFDKQAGGLLDCWSVEAVEQFIAAARQRGMSVALAGSLSAACVERLLPLEPEYVALRGAVCRGSRRSRVESHRVRQFADMLRRANGAQSPLPPGGAHGRAVVVARNGLDQRAQ